LASREYSTLGYQVTLMGSIQESADEKCQRG
jgi:hypothetical protein